MKLTPAVVEELMVRPGQRAGLDARSTSAIGAAWLDGGAGHRRELARAELASFADDLSAAQRKLWASGSHALLIVLQAMDAAGKDGTIRHVMSGVNPQGCSVEAFTKPGTDELDHDFLWLAARALPGRGMIGIYNRSHYEEVLVVRVHPELLGRGRPVADGVPPARLWSERYEDINAFERHLHRSGTRILKIYLHVSREVQKKRFLERLDNPDKNWKFSLDDLAERRHWDEYRVAYEDALGATSTPWAPWYVVPADHKYALRALVGGLVVDAIDAMDLGIPDAGPERRDALAGARHELLHEPD